MTSSALLFYILLAIFVQVVIFFIIIFSRHWLSYRKLDMNAWENQAKDTNSARILSMTTQTGWNGLRMFRVERKTYEDEMKSVCSFYLVPTDKLALPAYLPGQYLTFEFDIPTEDNKKTIRCYTLSEMPLPEYYRITVKKVPAPKDKPDVPAGLSSTYLHEQVNEGDLLSIKAPAGHFYLAPHMKEPLVLIAGGIGVTPMLSIMHAALHEDAEREIWFFFGVRNGKEHILKDHFEALADKYKGLHLHVCYSQAQQDDVLDWDYHHNGRVDIELLQSQLPSNKFQFFVCGPKPMMESIVPALEDWGVSHEHIHYESFGPATVIRHKEVETEAGESRAPLTITFSRLGKTLTWDPSYSCILEFAEANGIDMDFGCRAGSCGACQSLLTEGEVEYNQEPDLDVDAGACLPCISIPKTNIKLDI